MTKSFGMISRRKPLLAAMVTGSLLLGASLPAHSGTTVTTALGTTTYGGGTTATTMGTGQPHGFGQNGGGQQPPSPPLDAEGRPMPPPDGFGHGHGGPPPGGGGTSSSGTPSATQ